jgi:plastocyanin
VANVEISVFSYKPSELTVSVGTTVVWTNQDDITHTVSSGTSDHPGGPLSGTLPGKGATYSFKFDTAGEYPYFCNVHPSMVGKVIVK